MPRKLQKKFQPNRTIFRGRKIGATELEEDGEEEGEGEGEEEEEEEGKKTEGEGEREEEKVDPKDIICLSDSDENDLNHREPEIKMEQPHSRIHSISEDGAE